LLQAAGKAQINTNLWLNVENTDYSTQRSTNSNTENRLISITFFVKDQISALNSKTFFNKKTIYKDRTMLEKNLPPTQTSAKTLIDALKWTSSNSSQSRGEKASIEFHHFGTPEQDEMARKHACQESIISLGTSFPVCINVFWTIN
jgi:hypothetical protein